MAWEMLLYHADADIFESFRLPAEVSSFTAELATIKQFFVYCPQSPLTYLVILTESQASLLAIGTKNFNMRQNFINLQTKELHYTMKLYQKKLEFVWVKGGSGIDGNEQEDARASTQDAELHDIKISSSDLKTITRRRFLTNWQLRFDHTTTGVKYKETFKKLSSKPWFYKVSKRQHIRTISRIRTGHALHQEHRYRIGVFGTQDCMCGKNRLVNADNS